MQKRVYYFSTLVILSLFMISFISAFASAESVAQYLGGKINVNLGQININEDFWQGDGMARFLMFFLVALVVYSVAEFIPFLEKKSWVSIPFSLIIAYLSVIYLTSEEIRASLFSYSTLGIVVTGFIPLFVIVAISKKAHDQHHELFSRLLWIAFLVITLVRFFTAPAEYALSPGFVIVYSVLMGCGLIMLILQRYVYLFFTKEQLRGEVDASRRNAMINALGDATTARKRAAALREVGSYDQANELEDIAKYLDRRAQGKQ